MNIFASIFSSFLLGHHPHGQFDNKTLSQSVIQHNQGVEEQLLATPYEQALQVLQTVARDNPNSTRLFVLGVSDSGQQIVGIQIGQGTRSSLIVATHHGNEYGSTAVALAAVQYFAKRPLPDQTLFIIPVLNIQGYNQGLRYEYNKAGYRIDPNRDYPGPCQKNSFHNLASTRLLSQFIEQQKIVASATLHTYMPGVLYPWGHSTMDTATPDESTYRRITQLAVQPSGYTAGNSKELLYAADGTFEDYAYWQYGVWSLLYELGFSHYPSQSDITTMINKNLPSLEAFLKAAPAQRSTNHQFLGRCDWNVFQRERLE